MAFSKIIRKSFSLFSLTTTLAVLILTINGQSVSFGAGSVTDKLTDGSQGHFLTEEGRSQFLARPSLLNCAMANSPVIQYEGKLSPLKSSYVNPENARVYDYQYFVPLSPLRSKKAQKAIMLDVGDYVIKGNGASITEPGASSGRSPNMGGILRSSGK